MSSFLSNKVLRFRRGAGAGAGGVIDGDLHCTVCGYNLRGLPMGRNCPECGSPSAHTARPVRDPLLMGDTEQRHRVGVALTLIAACLLIPAPLALWSFIMMFAQWSPALLIYLWTGLVLCLAWIVGTWMLTGRSLRHVYSQRAWLALAARWSSLLWLAGHGLWMIAAMSTVGQTARGETLYAMSVLIRLFAGAGGLLFAWWLMMLAEDAELEHAARRIHLAIFVLPLPTIFLALMPDAVPWIALAVIGMVLLVWCWFVWSMGLGVLAMQRHVSWAARLAAEAPAREQRIQQTRAELQHKADVQVRPVPGGSASNAAAAPTVAGDRPCRACGYNLRGLRTGTRCPECGSAR